MTHNIQNYINQKQGYKLENTHFKVGSKYHADDFYYGKRFFQSSYYTSRIAVGIANSILEHLKSGDKSAKITLVGYELYSELLVSLVEELLDKNKLHVNHFVVQDTGKTLVCIPNIKKNEINETIFIIVPIASRGSTGNKIHSFLKKEFKDINVIEIYNVLQIADLDIDNKNELPTPQNIILKIATTWRLPESCELCFGSAESTNREAELSEETNKTNKTNEKNEITRKPLFETDKTGLTPSVIFEFPKNKKEKSPVQSTITLEDYKKDDIILYKKIKRNNDLFLFSTDTNKCLASLEISDKIDKWLKEVGKKIKPSSTEKVLLIAPCHYTNTRFINLVNNRIFNSAATILHYQTDVDYVANFNIVNERLINDSDKIYFVDDSIISGRTYFQILSLLHLTKENLSFDATIVLFDKTDNVTYERIKNSNRDNKFFFSFDQLNIPKTLLLDGRNPLEHETERYRELSQFSIHDFLIDKFNKRANELQENNLSHSETKNQKDRSERHFLLFQATHKLYEILGSIEGHRYLINSEQNNFDDFIMLVRECFQQNIPNSTQQTIFPDSKSNSAGGENSSSRDDELFEKQKIATMKALCHFPFLLYLSLRENTFKWHNNWLEYEIAKLNKTGYVITKNDIKLFKFLTRRSVFLGNMIICTNKGYFNAIQKILQSKDIEAHLQDFFIVQYVEIIQKNPWAALRIKKELHEFLGNKTSEETKAIQKFIRILEIELASVSNWYFSDFKNMTIFEKEDQQIKTEEDNQQKDSEENNQSTKSDNINLSLSSTFLNYFDNIKQHHLEGQELPENSFALTKTLFDFQPEKENDNFNRFCRYLTIRKFFHHDYKNNLKTSAANKLETLIEVLMEQCLDLFPKELEVGGFMLISDVNDHIELMFDKVRNKDGKIQNGILTKDDYDEPILDMLEIIQNADKSYRKSKVPTEKIKARIDTEQSNKERFFKDLKINKDTGSKLPKSISILCYQIVEHKAKTGFSDWKNLYEIESNPDKLYKKSKFEGYYLILVKITKFEDNNFETLGVLGFYSKDKRIYEDLLSRQLLMLMRNDFARFFEKHHKNDEFSAWRMAEQSKRLSYLAGHGRDVYKALLYDETLRPIIFTMEDLQYLFATSKIGKKGNINETFKAYSENTYLIKNLFKSDSFKLNKLEQTLKEIFVLILDSEHVEFNLNKLYCFQPLFNKTNTFKFNQRIIKFICLELFINAKKNRHHDINSDDFQNEFGVTLNKTAYNCLEISVSNTGPSIDPEVKRKIENGDNTKKTEQELSGIHLINKVIREFHIENSIKVTSEKELNKDYCTNTITIKLNAYEQ